jgi:16S rRNA (cytosine967-C5)-methyltransferase
VSARSVAYQVLLEVEREAAYANLVLPPALAASGLSERDKALTTELVYGSARREGELDVVIAGASGRSLGELQVEVLVVLRLGVYQMLYLRVPDHAAVDESVSLAKSQGLQRASGLVNAILRNVTRRPAAHWQEIIDADARVVSSHPVWIAEAFDAALQQSVGAGELAEALEAHNVSPKVTLAHLPGLSVPGGSSTEFSPLGEALQGGNPAGVTGVPEGIIRVQDEGSQLAALLLSRVQPLQPAELVLDLCSGPGGKTAVLAAEALGAGAHVVAWEKAPHRARLVEKSVAAIVRRNPATVVVATGDALEIPAEPGSFSRVLVDAPCSGLGALRRRPEARWRKSPDDIPALVDLQLALLSRALELVAPGGIVAYVTCSPMAEETVDVVAAVCAVNRECELIDTPAVLDRVSKKPVVGARRGSAVQLWTYRHGCDDMFIQLIRRTESLV